MNLELLFTTPYRAILFFYHPWIILSNTQNLQQLLFCILTPCIPRDIKFQNKIIVSKRLSSMDESHKVMI